MLCFKIYFFILGIIFCFTDLSLNNSCWAEARETHCREDKAKWERERHRESHREGDEKRREKASKIGDRGVLRCEVTGDSLKLLGNGGPLRKRVRRGILAGLPLSWRITSHLKWLPGWQPLDRQFAIIPGPISLTFSPSLSLSLFLILLCFSLWCPMDLGSLSDRDLTSLVIQMWEGKWGKERGEFHSSHKYQITSAAHLHILFTFSVGQVHYPVSKSSHLELTYVMWHHKGRKQRCNYSSRCRSTKAWTCVRIITNTRCNL